LLAPNKEFPLNKLILAVAAITLASILLVVTGTATHIWWNFAIFAALISALTLFTLLALVAAARGLRQMR
jgi:hypothetical protein